MSYSSVPTEPENATTAIGGRRYSLDTPTRVFHNGPIILQNNDGYVSTASTPPPTGSQLRRSSKIGRSSGEFKKQSIKFKLSSKYNKLTSSESEDIRIIMPLPSQLSKDFKDEQESFSTHDSNRTVSEILKMSWIDEDDKFSKKFWLVFVIGLLLLFCILIIGFGIYAYYT